MHISKLGKFVIGAAAAWAVTKAVQHDLRKVHEPLTGFRLLKHLALGGNWLGYNFQIDAMGFGTTTYEERCNLWTLYREGKVG